VSADHPITTPAQISAVAMENIRATAKAIETALIGRFVRVTSDHNGQPYGRSHKSWRGEVAKIKYVLIDIQDSILLTLEGHEYECMIPADEVEFT
jgi:hypothetical protein